MSDHPGRAETAAPRPPARYLSPLSTTIWHTVDTRRYVVQQAKRPSLAHRRRQQFPVSEHQVSRPVCQRRLPMTCRKSSITRDYGGSEWCRSLTHLDTLDHGVWLIQNC